MTPYRETTWGQGWNWSHPLTLPGASGRSCTPNTVALDKGGRYTWDNYTAYYLNSDAGVIGEARIDDRLDTKDLVVGLVVGDEAKAYAFDDLSEQPVVNDSVGDRNVVIAFDADSSTGNCVQPRCGRANPGVPHLRGRRSH